MVTYNSISAPRTFAGFLYPMLSGPSLTTSPMLLVFRLIPTLHRFSRFALPLTTTYLSTTRTRQQRLLSGKGHVSHRWPRPKLGPPRGTDRCHPRSTKFQRLTTTPLGAEVRRVSRLPKVLSTAGTHRYHRVGACTSLLFVVWCLLAWLWVARASRTCHRGLVGAATPQVATQDFCFLVL